MNFIYFNKIERGVLSELLKVFPLVETDEDRVRFAMEFYFWLGTRSPNYPINTKRVIVERIIFYCIGRTNGLISPWEKTLYGVYLKMQDEDGKEPIKECQEEVRHLELL